MATILVNDIIRVVDYMKLPAASQAGLNIHYYKADTVVGAPTTLQVANGLATQRGPLYAACLSAQAQYDGCTAQRFMGPLPLEEPVPSNLGFPDGGVVAGDALPSNIAGIISWKTGKAGRKYRGRSYIPFPGEASNAVAGLPEAAYLTQLANLGNKLQTPALIDDGAGNTVQLKKVIVHGRAPGSAYDLVTTKIVRGLWAQQHRRGDYGRTNTGGPFA